LYIKILFLHGPALSWYSIKLVLSNYCSRTTVQN